MLSYSFVHFSCQLQYTGRLQEISITSHTLRITLIFSSSSRGHTIKGVCKTPANTLRLYVATRLMRVWVTLQVPFGDTFHQQLQWACQQEGPGRCRLRITGQVKFTKGCFVKGIIQKASEEVRLFFWYF